MTIKMRSIVPHRSKAAATLLVILLAGCQPATPPMTPKEQAHMKILTDHMTPRCFGRYLIDLPADMKPGKVFGTKIEGVEIKVTPMPRVMFDSQIQKRKALLESMHMDGEPTQPVLKEVTSLSGGTEIVFNRAKGGLSRALRILELHGWKDDYAIKMTVDTFDESFPEDQDDPQLRAMGTDTPQKLALLQALYARTRGRAESEIPSGQGACFQSGFVSGPASDEVREDLAMDFVSASMPDVVVHLESDSGIRTDTVLLDRLADIKANLKMANGHIVRKGSRVSKTGLHFDEVLSAGITLDDKVMGNFFTLEANSKIGSAKTPLINMDFWNGQREGKPAPDDPTSDYQPPDPPPLAKASLSEAEAINLWDAITSTLRPRPGAF